MAEKSLNKVMLIGRLGKDPELKYTPSGVAVATFSIATNQSWKDESGNFKDKTDWHNLVAWRKLAEVCNEYLKKGSKVYIEGKLQTRSYDDKEGNKKYITEIVIADMVMLDSKGDGSRGEGARSEGSKNFSAPAAETNFNDHPGHDDTIQDNDDLPF